MDFENNQTPDENKTPEEADVNRTEQEHKVPEDMPYSTIPVDETQTNGMATAALICGILGLIGGWIPVVQYFTLVLSILAIIFGVIGRKRAPAGKTGVATAGMVLGIIAVALTVIGVICVCTGAALIGSAAVTGAF